MPEEINQADPGPPPAPWQPAAGSISVLESSCGIVDRSHRGRLIVSGSDAASLLQGQLSNDIEALEVGAGCEAALLTAKGKLLAIVRVLRTDSDRLMLDTDRASLQALFDQLRRSIVGHAAELEKATLETSQLSLIGPLAATVVGTSDLVAEHDHRLVMLGGCRARVVSTWEGVDVICPAESVDGVITALRGAGAELGDEAAAECLRVEAGRPRWGIDLDDGVIPQEADLNGRLVSFTKGCYVGQETVARLFYRGSPNRTLRGLLLDDIVEPGTPLRLGDRQVGAVGSVAAPTGDAVRALALLRLAAEPGSVLDAGGIEAEVFELPFPAPDAPSGAA